MGLRELKRRGSESQSFLHDGHLEHQDGISSPKWGLITTSSLAFFVFTYAVMGAYILHCRLSGPQSQHFAGNEGIYDDAPIVYERRRFQRAGFHDTRHDVTNEFEGPPTALNNAAWDNLLSVGMVIISPTENRLLSSPTAPTRANPNEFIVELEMFHQLHCLKWLRNEFWVLEEAISNRQQPQNQSAQRREHAGKYHCIDYLRQVVMCHGDITPITFEWNKELNTYLAHHSTEHICRDFNAIFNWANLRAAKDFDVDGDHKNVELQEPEMFD